MSEEQNTFWRRHIKGRLALIVWAGIATGVLILGLYIAALANFSRSVTDTLQAAGLLGGMIFGVLLLAVYGLLPLAKFLFRNWRRLGFVLVTFATLIALFYAVENWRGKRAWEQFKREWEAKGEKFEFKDFVPAQIPDEENFAMADVVASSYEYILTRTGGKIPYEKRDTNAVNRLDFGSANNDLDRAVGKVTWMGGARAELKNGWEAFAARTNLFNPTQTDAQRILRALDEYSATIEDLRLASQRTQSRFPLNYSTDCPADILLPQLAAMKRATHLLYLRGLAELQENQSDQAMRDTKLIFRLAEAIRAEPFIISHLVRISIVQRAMQPIYEGLAAHRWSEAQLMELDKQLAGLDFLADAQFCVRGEIGMQSGVFDYLKLQPSQLKNLSGEGNNNSSSGTSRWIPTGWFYQNQLRCARFTMVNQLPIINVNQQTISPVQARQVDRAYEKETRRITPYNFIERILLPNFNLTKFGHAQASVHLARTAIALERYRLVHGNYPESLDVLAPQFITKVQHDVIGGGSLKYRREADGTFTLYSIGWNEKDDGGVVVNFGKSSEVDKTKGDWVWRYPAKN